jgi:cell division transport system permease protein
MSLRSLEFASSESFTGIKRNALMSLASIITMGLALSVLGGFSLLILGLNHTVQAQLQKFEIAAFVEKGRPESVVKDLDQKIRALPHVRTVQLVTAEEAWLKFRQDRGDSIDLSGVKHNPLPDTFRITTDDPASTADVAGSIRKMDGMDEVNEAGRELEQVMRLTNLIKLIGGVAVALLFLVTAFIVGNTIRMTVYARRREIRIMQLVGATNWFIRLPFVFEGTMLGTVGGGIACVLVFFGARYVSQTATRIMPLLSQFSSNVDPLQFFGCIVLVGAMLGMMSSMISVRRFLSRV